MFLAHPASASFVDMAMTTGRAFLRWLFTAMVAGVSVKPSASFAAVFEVQGATTMISHIFFGPIGSASSMVRMTLRPAMASRRLMFSSAVPKRVDIALRPASQAVLQRQMPFQRCRKSRSCKSLFVCRQVTFFVPLSFKMSVTVRAIISPAVIGAALAGSPNAHTTRLFSFAAVS